MERNKKSGFVATASVLALSVATIAFAKTITVNNNGPADFPTIQAAVNDANDGDVVLVAPGTYTGDGNHDIDFRGKAITVKSEQGPATCIIVGGGKRDDWHRGFHIRRGEGPNSTVEGFTITKSSAEGVACSDSSPRIKGCIVIGNGGLGGGGGIRLAASNSVVENCIIAGNWNGSGGGGGVYCGSRPGVYSRPTLRNCTIVGNRAPSFGGGVFCDDRGVARIENCIVAGNLRTSSVSEPRGTQICGGGCNAVVGCMDVEIRHCAVSDEPNSVYVGAWSLPYRGTAPVADYIKVNPQFTDPGHWDANGTSVIGDDFWVQGDYHLKSQAGRWDPASKSWIKDDVTSPCIDAGDPNSPIGEEPFPNGGRINMGAYGGTAEASKSYFREPVCETMIPGDINGDCRVDFADLSILASHWLQEAPDRSTHLGRE